MVEMFVKLLLGHLLADYALQGDFMAKAKNQTSPIPGVPWLTILMSHAAIHACVVYLVTGSLWLAVVELLGHALTDYCKSDGTISFNTDQIIHISMKAFYAGVMA